MKQSNSFFEDGYKNSMSSLKNVLFQGSSHDDHGRSLWVKGNSIVHQTFLGSDCEVTLQNRISGNTLALNFNKFFQKFLFERNEILSELERQYSSKKVSLAFMKSR